TGGEGSVPACPGGLRELRPGHAGGALAGLRLPLAAAAGGGPWFLRPPRLLRRTPPPVFGLENAARGASVAGQGAGPLPGPLRALGLRRAAARDAGDWVRLRGTSASG